MWEADQTRNKYINTSSDQLWRRTLGGHVREWQVQLQYSGQTPFLKMWHLSCSSKIKKDSVTLWGHRRPLQTEQKQCEKNHKSVLSVGIICLGWDNWLSVYTLSAVSEVASQDQECRLWLWDRTSWWILRIFHMYLKTAFISIFATSR